MVLTLFYYTATMERLHPRQVTTAIVPVWILGKTQRMAPVLTLTLILIRVLATTSCLTHAPYLTPIQTQT